MRSLRRDYPTQGSVAVRMGSDPRGSGTREGNGPPGRRRARPPPAPPPIHPPLPASVLGKSVPLGLG